MDTSEEYIKMCGEADEIQKLWRKSEGDFYAAGEHTCKDFTHPQLVNGVIGECNPFNHRCGSCGRNFYADIWWLPRQDQLQNMCLDLNKFKPIYSLGYVLMWAEEGMGVECGANDYVESLGSLEQVWLAYVMDEKYGKKWNGSEWVKA